MSYKTQPRDSKGRFLSKKEVAKPTPKKPTSRKKKVEEKDSDVIIFSNFLLDDTTSIKFNGMQNSLKSGYLEALNAISSSCKVNKIDLYYGLSLFGVRNNKHYVYSNSLDSMSKIAYDYNPSQGRTALYSGIIYIINKMEEYINNICIVNPGKVIKPQLTILTDGEDNDSGSLFESAKKLINEKIKLGWNISFIGNSSTSIKLGIDKSNTLDFETSEEGTKTAMGIYTSSIDTYVDTVSRGVDSNVGFFA